MDKMQEPVTFDQNAETIDNETTIAEQNDYITATRKNFVSNDNEGRMVEKCIIEIQGTFLVKIRNDTFNGSNGENAYEHINKFLEIVKPIKINGLTQARFRLSVFHVSLVGAAHEWFTKECLGSITTWDNMLEKFILKFHHLSDHNEEEIKEDGNPNVTDNMNNNKAKGAEEPWELPGMVRVGSMTYFQDHRWYDEPDDGKLKDETLALKAKIEVSWGDATLGVIKLCRWLKSCFENFHELEYEMLVKLQECWWKVNTHEIAPFTRMENFRRGPYANIKTEWANNPYLDINRTFGKDYEANNIDFRRFEMMKYSFDDDEEYITIKEYEYLKHSKDSLDAYRELFDEGWVITTTEE
ncbi:hypothetical protein Tco_1338127 [Tanacetum coccineum]